MVLVRKFHRNPIEILLKTLCRWKGEMLRIFGKSENSKFLTSLFSGMECPQNGSKSIYIIIRDYFGVLPDRFCTFGLEKYEYSEKCENYQFLTSLFSGMECPQNGSKSIYIIIRDYLVCYQTDFAHSVSASKNLTRKI